ncbi:hypothetical protein TEA_010696 [Camellia sinensis var. sinensis]|uniref:UBC core domain-containing protein n=1 Tax=Camellia sinensis var. sinensis TaxID=542762 RepID=A0A4S4E4E1_CAMSN|nr:hypothetical protein TEA_010696 [Camellia sinensis var. sinensis]
MANSNLPQRIIKETQRLLNEPAPGTSASPSEDNMRYFNVMILGPTQFPYEGGIFKLELFLPEEYLMAAPKKQFKTVTQRYVTGRYGCYGTITTAISAATADTSVNLNHTAKAAVTGDGNYHNRYVTVTAAF